MTTKSKGVTVKDVAASQFIAEYAAHLKRNQWLKLPDWLDLVKTGVARELAPQDPDWYYVRAGMSFFHSVVD
jgi:small subunit ribosomal protein S19e